MEANELQPPAGGEYPGKRTSAVILADQQKDCPRPFEWCEIHPDGSIFLCCPAWLKRPVGNLLHQTAADIWNGPRTVEIRKSILNGSYHNCSKKRCPRLVAAGTGAVESASSAAADAITRGLTRLGYLPPRLNLCFDYSCNLACPSCRRQRRTSAGAAHAQAAQLAERVRLQLLPTACQLTLSGYGDPFGSPVYFELLKQIRRRDAPQLAELRLHSNGLLFDETRWRQLPELHRLLKAVEISVDAASPATYALNRGGDFHRLRRNLEFIAGLKVPLRLSMVVQQNNFREIGALHSIAQQLGAELYLSRLVNWGTFTRTEFIARDVAAERHPEHRELLQVLAELKGEGSIDCGNLLQLLAS